MNNNSRRRRRDSYSVTTYSVGQSINFASSEERREDVGNDVVRFLPVCEAAAQGVDVLVIIGHSHKLNEAFSLLPTRTKRTSYIEYELWTLFDEQLSNVV